MNYLQEESYKPFQSVPKEACLYQNSKFCIILREDEEEEEEGLLQHKIGIKRLFKGKINI